RGEKMVSIMALAAVGGLADAAATAVTTGDASAGVNAAPHRLQAELPHVPSRTHAHPVLTQHHSAYTPNGGACAAGTAGLEGAMTLIDTAEIYGSEPLVAKAVDGRKREDLFIATKVWPNHLRRDAVSKALRQSLRRLRLDYVDLYQIHWPNPSVPISETMS